jgi:hypothetical protein
MAVRIHFGQTTSDPSSAFGHTQDAIVIDGELGDVAHQLATSAGGGSWPRLTKHWGEKTLTVHVNPDSIRYVEEVPDR